MSSGHVVVFGASTLIGHSVVEALSKQYDVRAVVPKGSSPDPTLTSLGVKVTEVDLDSRAEVTEVLKGAVAAFVHTISDNARQEGYDNEIRQGRCIADACQRAGVGQVVFSTQLSVMRTLGVRAKHMDAKAEVETYMRELDLPLTGVVIPCLYQDFLQPPLRPSRIQPGVYALNIPMASVPLYLMSADDIGPMIVSLLATIGRFRGKTISLCGDKLTVREIAAVLSKNLAPDMFFQDKQVTLQSYRELPYPGIDNLANMFDFFTRVDQRASLDLNKELYPNVQSFDQWLAANRGRVIEAMDYPEAQKIDPWQV